MANFYDTDDIMIEEELVPVIFQVSANGVELLESGEEADKVEQGTKVELPFWLASELQERQAVSVEIPMCFNKKTKDEIVADAAHVDLRTRCPYFYELGLKIEPIVADKTIRNLLLGAFAIRYKDVLVKAQTAALAVVPKFLTLLTKEEMKLYEAAQSSLIAFKKWRMGGPRFQRASVLGRKRRSDEYR